VTTDQLVVLWVLLSAMWSLYPGVTRARSALSIRCSRKPRVMCASGSPDHNHNRHRNCNHNQPINQCDALCDSEQKNTELNATQTKSTTYQRYHQHPAIYLGFPLHKLYGAAPIRSFQCLTTVWESDNDNGK